MNWICRKDFGIPSDEVIHRREMRRVLDGKELNRRSALRSQIIELDPFFFVTRDSSSQQSAQPFGSIVLNPSWDKTSSTEFLIALARAAAS
jgi:hypothetical protein